MMLRPSLILSLTALASYTSAQNASLPIVDLGHERHQAITLNTYGFYNFSNIPYAEPPLGDLRFRAPVAPAGTSAVINKGTRGAICPSGLGRTSAAQRAYVDAYVQGEEYDYAGAVASAPATADESAIDPLTSEDCLLLDVVVPKAIFDDDASGGAPVLVWIHGGGYNTGSKLGGEGSTFDPTGLMLAGESGFIFVALNYRLGALGWLAGPTLRENGTQNAGLYDKRMALQWVQDNIHLFGGDKDRVTVMGKSAGGGSIMHHITSYGGNDTTPPFQQAIVLEPAFNPKPDDDKAEAVFQSFLLQLGVDTLDEARAKSSEEIIAANLQNIYSGDGSYGPAIDGTYVPKLPGQLLLEGSYHQDLNVLVSHNANEGLLFVPPTAKSAIAYEVLLRRLFPTSSLLERAYISTKLYPPVFDGTHPYTNNYERAVLTVGEAIIACNSRYLAGAFGNATHAFEFAVYPAIHSQDTPYVFLAPSTEAEFAGNATIAGAEQQYIASFVLGGKPVAEGLPEFPEYGAEASVMSLGSDGIAVVEDDVANSRCAWWQKAAYY